MNIIEKLKDVKENKKGREVNKILLKHIFKIELVSDKNKERDLYGSLISTIQSPSISKYISKDILDMITLLAYRMNPKESSFLKRDLGIIDEIKSLNFNDFNENDFVRKR